MSKIQIAELQVTGTELFEGNESFLTELQPMEASAVFGGKGCAGKKSGGKSSGKKKSGGCKIGKSSNKSSGNGCGGGTPVPTPVPVPAPAPFVP
jgi:hypothetical protein